MNQLNYHHLYYFYVTVKEGTIAQASQTLHVTPQTVSGQIASFEQSLGFRLFLREGKKLVLSDQGKRVYQHADKIFEAGHALIADLRNQFSETLGKLTIGVTDAIPKVLLYDFVAPALKQVHDSHFVFKEGSFDELVAELAVNNVDIVLADHGLPPGSSINAAVTALGRSDISFFADAETAAKLQKTFPHSINNQPFLMPGTKSGLNISLSSWLQSEHIYPAIMAEFDDSALLKLFGSEGHGVFCAPSCIEAHVEKQYSVSAFGRINAIQEHFYAITPKALLKHPLIRAIIDNASNLLAASAHEHT